MFIRTFLRPMINGQTPKARINAAAQSHASHSTGTKMKGTLPPLALNEL